MNDVKKEAVFSYFDGRIEECSRQRNALLDDGRKDEAVFEKIRANVYDIFKSVFTVALKSAKGTNDPEAVQKFYLQKMEELPSAWRDSYKKAEQFGDVEKLHIESIKLETLEEIRSSMKEIWGDKQ
ncbi:hypothetical protein HNQ56_001307 [Anaerotaenia torta]|uniref:hypothetical protein n=1 Tax=Anaerotaenia torta TaxID=433293 RepID=UPI003D1A300C